MADPPSLAAQMWLSPSRLPLAALGSGMVDPSSAAGAILAVKSSASRDRQPIAKALLRRPNRLAFIGNSLPRRCGIATFTTHLHQAISSAGATTDTSIVAMTDHHHLYDYPPEVGCQIHDESIGDYHRAAEFLSSGRFNVVSLQHEF